MSTTIAPMLASINGGPGVPAILNIETEQIDVTTTTKTKPDMKWEHTDPSGHFHAFDKNGELPTLKSHSEHVACPGVHTSPVFDDDDCEGYDELVYECVICGATVEPVWITTPSVCREFMPGRTYWTVEVEQQVTEEWVSVRLTSGEIDMFGVARRGAARAEGGPDGMRVWRTLCGEGALGDRWVRELRSVG